MMHDHDIELALSCRIGRNLNRREVGFDSGHVKEKDSYSAVSDKKML